MIKHHLLIVYAATAPLFFLSLGGTHLWTDEAQTAQLGRSVLDHGLPYTGTGPDSVSADCGLDAGFGGLHLQLPWGQAYAAAASMGILGPSPIAARLPFAAAGWACVFLSAWLVGLAGGTTRDRWLAAGLTGTSVYFLLHARQARYYALGAALLLLVVGSYWRFLRGERRAGTALALSLCGLVLVFDVAAIGALAGIGLHTVVRWRSDRSGWRSKAWRLAQVVGGPVALLGVWILLASTAATRSNFAFDAGVVLKPVYYAVQYNAHVLPLLVVVPALWVVRRHTPDSNRARMLGIIVAILAGALVAAFLPPFMFPRYMIAAVPVALCGLALLIGSAAQQTARPNLIALLIGLALVSGIPHKLSHDLVRGVAEGIGLGARMKLHPAEAWRPYLLDLMAELADPPRGPLAAVASHLNGYAEPGDVVLTTYGVPSLRFHTSTDPYGGLTCQVPDRTPEWIWLRAHWSTHRNAQVAVDWMNERVDLAEYEAVPVEAPDRRYENREDLHEHVFGNPGPDAPPTQLLRRRPDR